MTVPSIDARPSEGEPLLDVEDLQISAVAGGGQDRPITVGTDLSVAAGETVGIVGESGSGKSLTARAIMRLLPEGVVATGRATYRGVDLFALPESEMRRMRGRRISMMFQDPFTMLNPLLRCGGHIEEMIAQGRRRALPRERRREEVARRLAEVGIRDPSVGRRFPFQLSGGMRQRVALAAALAKDPDLLIADEPSTALDVTTQAEILDLLSQVQKARGMGLILITHDLRVAFSTCDRIYVLYAGSLLEVGDAMDLEREPLHPYTLGLLLSEPPVRRKMPELVAIKGAVPPPDEVAGICAFAPRCTWVEDVCGEKKPDLALVSPGRQSACVRIEAIRTDMDALRRRALQAVSAASEEVAETVGSIVRVQDLVKIFETGRGATVEALKGVSLEFAPGESVGLVGESGSGKTTLGRCLVGLETPTDGLVEIDGIAASDFARMSSQQRAAVRRTIQMIFQDPYSTLNPRHRVDQTLWEALRARSGSQEEPSRRSRNDMIGALLGQVGLPSAYARRKPASLSGGERQRVAIARALAVRPEVLVCDEPVSALDVSVQAQILNLFKSLQQELGIAYLFITHDLAVVRQVVDRVYVLYEGDVVEEGRVDEVLSRPQHPYTRRLIESIPTSEQQRREETPSA